MPPVLAEQDVEEMRQHLLRPTLRYAMLRVGILRHICSRSWPRHQRTRDRPITFGTMDSGVLHLRFGTSKSRSRDIPRPLYGDMMHGLPQLLTCTHLPGTFGAVNAIAFYRVGRESRRAESLGCTYSMRFLLFRFGVE